MEARAASRAAPSRPPHAGRARSGALSQRHGVSTKLHVDCGIGRGAQIPLDIAAGREGRMPEGRDTAALETIVFAPPLPVSAPEVAL